MLQIDRYSEIGQRSTNQDCQQVAEVGAIHCVVVADGVGDGPEALKLAQ